MGKTSRQQIIETAERLILETDSPEVSLTQISSALGITHGALYKHFQNKQALWTAVAIDWFNREIINKISIPAHGSVEQQLHDWLWRFVNAKKKAANVDPKMFTLNTFYIDNNPRVLHQVLTGAYSQINQILHLTDNDYQHAEAILATFAIFTLPNFKDTWNDPNYQQRFEEIWKLIKNSIG
ncbi:TetR/AcrR family transcriptional regulator [Lactiplantibacillus plantarum]|uniref:TetR/AcrR family transcriptional regulator n=1 Tax=Lactiplantibacillus plantarum TaxID=1590 RepID=UPI001364419A|nr:TetR/AcrR family transcriptional regulator [Lactiplantibacillus plantarum]QHM38610.1 hypothetical protein C7M36_02923 [Lactiplantibacillus plantarum]